MSSLLQEALVPRVPTAQPCQLPPPALTCAKKRQHRKGDPKRANTSGSELTSDMQSDLGKQAQDCAKPRWGKGAVRHLRCQHSAVSERVPTWTIMASVTSYTPQSLTDSLKIIS